ncbi:DUF4124 domain-containing protein [Microbulbifer variabilis]|uniref:DUF4124 domain-containing protein n=1 Tax=Microbulbifer variabilis TaxID=266805 RepID=A0ABY4VAK8_9GAMM|nr:DUF4124 domain-containing protein [Microbulbifer variabilis]USD21325.1 DUF4124 domain-containing protein [Microbulbifer variabilis]
MKLLQALFLAVPLVAFAGTDGGNTSSTIYKVVGPDGQVTFSDTPPPNGQAQEVQLAPINVQPIALPRTLPTRKLSPKDETDTGKEGYTGPVSIQIVSPLDGATIPPGQRFIPLQVDVQPVYPEGASFFAVVDGKPWQGSSSGAGLDISLLERGTHTVQAVLTDSKGQVLAQSQVVTLYVKRPGGRLPDNSAPRAPQAPRAPVGPGIPQAQPSP